ncbi:LacI family DNA-binding transcriptional regulator [Streptacidiphilus monticola]
MDHVARHAGVSRTTVSFVLNNRQGAAISAATRRRILDAVEELGYRPDAGARALAGRRTDWYGLITEIVTEPFAVDIIKGAQDRAWSERRFLLIASGRGEPEQESAALEKLLEQRVAGLLYATTWHRPVQVPPAARELPTVLVNCTDADGELPCVIPDEFAGGHRATRRLLDAGHERIGFLTLDPAIPASIGRRAGYEQALREAGIDPDPQLVVPGYGDARRGHAAAAALLARQDRPTALFCGNDRMAMGAYDAIKERGLRIPEDVAVVGFDDQELIAAFLRPALTTVALPFEAMGAAGVDLLAALTAGEAVPDAPVTVDCPLVERASV